MQDRIATHTDGLRVRGFVVIFRCKSKSQVDDSWLSLGGRTNRRRGEFLLVRSCWM